MSSSDRRCSGEEAMKRKGIQPAVWAAAFLALVCSCRRQEATQSPLEPNAALKPAIDAPRAEGSAENLIPLEAKVEALWPKGTSAGYELESTSVGFTDV